MAKNDNLTDFLTDVADAIREKKGTTDKINPQDFSSEIASIESGTPIIKLSSGVKFAYSTCKEMPFEIDSSGVTDMSYLFMNCHYLTNFAIIDYSQATALSNAFRACYKLSTPPFDTFPPNVKQLISTFSYSGITSIPETLDFSQITNTEQAFAYCGSLTTVPYLDTKKCTDMYNMFTGCSKLISILGVDLTSCTRVGNFVGGCNSLNFMLINNLGKSTLGTYDFSGTPIWGTGSDENKQSLIDSLITNSYDRASNGMTTVTIKLSSTTKALLTDDEIAQITAKGFTIA